MSRILSALFVVLACSCSSGLEVKECPVMPPDTTYGFDVLRVIDGDTIEIMVDIGFETYRKIGARLDGVDTPEIYGVKKWADAEKTQYTEEYAAGAKASKFTAAWLQSECPCTVSTTGTGKYGRWIVVIQTASGESLNAALVESGNAVLVDY